jgi:hypothetical protein
MDETRLSIQDLAEVLTVVLIEVVAAVSPDAATASERLEDIGGRLLDAVGGLLESPPRKALRALAHQLIKTEGGAA